MEADDKQFGTKTSLLPTIEFRNTYGRVGFRVHLDQGADIRNLKINAN